MPPMDRGTHSSAHIPRSDSPRDRSAPFAPYRCIHRKSRAIPALAKTPLSRCSNTPRPPESETASATPSNIFLHPNRITRDPAISPAPAPTFPSAASCLPRRPSPPPHQQTTKETLDDRSHHPPRHQAARILRISPSHHISESRGSPTCIDLEPRLVLNWKPVSRTLFGLTPATNCHSERSEPTFSSAFTRAGLVAL